MSNNDNFKKLNVFYVDIDQLKFAEYNPRKATKKQYQQLKKSITEFGFVEPVVVNSAENRKNIIIGGHFRVKVAKDIGIKQVPVIYLNITDIEKEKELNLRLNKNTGDWDWDLLMNFDEIMLKDVGFEETEFIKIFGIEKSKTYTSKIQTPVYIPNNIEIEVSNLYNDEKCQELLRKINELDIEDKQLKKFLNYAAYRFVEINFKNVAEYYAQLKDEKIKKIFQDLALF